MDINSGTWDTNKWWGNMQSIMSIIMVTVNSNGNTITLNNNNNIKYLDVVYKLTNLAIFPYNLLIILTLFFNLIKL